jgi:hypothetical protein
MRMHKEGRKKLSRLLIMDDDASHRKLAEACGWKSHAMVGHLISGRKVGVSPTAALSMCAFFDVEVGDFFVVEKPTKSCVAPKRNGRAA